MIVTGPENISIYDKIPFNKGSIYCNKIQAKTIIFAERTNDWSTVIPHSSFLLRHIFHIFSGTAMSIQLLCSMYLSPHPSPESVISLSSPEESVPSKSLPKTN
jgi:hypothetical protein